ncbi:MAG: tryptophan 2,3-dioxygenase family protein [Flavobacterium sp.]|nr:tryptophan 2,3-dioxygenase family protein [Flavobacterium sp.]
MEPNIQGILDQIKKQYHFQNDKELISLLEGLASQESKGVTYWDYIETDTLLSLQKPKTNYPDEVIFITYHQICELYFKLMIQEIERINDFYEIDLANKNHKIPCKKLLKNSEGKITGTIELNELETWNECLNRVIRYWQNLITSFDVLKTGMSTAEYGEFRKVLSPASGFQTYQFRKIEIMLTPLQNLTIPSSENKEEIYWRKGAMNITDNTQASKLLMNFNAKYDKVFFELIENYKGKTLFDRFQKMNPELQASVKPLLEKIENSILLWKIAHMNMVFQHIPTSVGATGGTNYTNYLPQLRAQSITDNNNEKEILFNKKYQVIYFPDFWKDKNPKDYIELLITKLPEEISDVVEKLYSQASQNQKKPNS